MNYTIGDFLIRLKNAYMAHKPSLTVQQTKTVLAICDVLKKEGYIKDVKKVQSESIKMLEISLQYPNRTPSVLDVEIISKPSFRVYIRKNDVKNLLREVGTHVLSTNQGVISAQEAMKKGLGGELICHVI